MIHDTAEGSRFKWVLGAAALGALTMFLMDPDRGNRRRALAKDKAYSMAVRTRKQINAKTRDLANRAKGLRAEAQHLVSGDSSASDTAGDTNASPDAK
jgi:gas vesicle protein